MLSARTLGRLRACAPLALDARRTFAVKRNVHEITVDADPDAFAAALREVLAEPGARFGALVLRRAPDRVGKPFSVGERFMGCLDLSPWLGEGRLAAWLEERFAGDTAEVVELGDRRAAYRYLDGSPIAGQSVLDVEDAPAGCRLRAVFEYQEIAPLAALVLHTFALREHDRAVLAQAQAAARRLGARVIESTIALP